MQPAQKIETWLKNPCPLWEPAVTESLTSAFAIQNNSKGYSIEKSISGIYDLSHLMPLGHETSSPFLELPANSLKAFYDEHGLVPIFFTANQAEEAFCKLNCAFEIIKLVETVYSDITRLVKTIQIIQSEYPETDVSYSHPDIPFSIFVSLCDPASLISDLRIAESILHEAMHLKLTLIENVVPLINFGSRHVYYSPWRDEKRQIRGVLHGMFVFRAIYDFYGFLEEKVPHDDVQYYLVNRRNCIKEELNQLREFPYASGLSKAGQKFAFKLLL